MKHPVIPVILYLFLETLGNKLVAFLPGNVFSRIDFVLYD